MRMKIEPARRAAIIAAMDKSAEKHGYTVVGHTFRNSEHREAVAAIYVPTDETAEAELCPAFDLLDDLDRIAHTGCWSPINRHVDDCLTVEVCYASDPREAATRSLVALMLGMRV